MKIAENVYAVLGLDHPYGVNAGFFVTSEGIIVVDSGYTRLSAQTIAGYANAVAPGKAINFLVLTEPHSDHVFGACVFKELGVKIIAHRKTKEFLEEKGSDYVRQMISRQNKIWSDAAIENPLNYDLGANKFCGVKVVVPDQTIENEETLQFGDEEVMIISTPGHTEGNICVYLPRNKILFASDTICSGYPPNTRFGNPALWQTWINALKSLKEMDIDKIVPGHGGICGKDEIERNISCLRMILHKSSDLRARNS